MFRRSMLSFAMMLIAAIVSLLSPLQSAFAQSTGSSPLRIILPVPAGGGLDALARAMSDALSEDLKRPVIVESKPGAAGNIAAEHVANSTPDGSTILLAFDSVATINPFIYSKTVFAPDPQLKPVALVGLWGFMLVVNPSTNATTLKDLVALSKTRPLRVASSGTGSGSHLALVQFQRESGLSAIHVPYRGAAPGVTDVIGGHVDAMFAVSTVAIPQIKAGKLRALAYTSHTRSPLAPDVPTLAERGYRHSEFTGSYVFFVPTATPESTIARLYSAIADVARRPEVRERFSQQDVIDTVLPPAEAAAWIERTRNHWGPLIRAARVTAE